MPHISNYMFNTKSFNNEQESPQQIIKLPQDYDFSKQADIMFLQPLMTGKAYHVEIKEFAPLNQSSVISRYLNGLDKELQNAYRDDYNVIFRPYVVHFEFHYDTTFIQNLKTFFAENTASRYCSNIVREIKDLRRFDMPCAIFGDFDLEYIDKEGWYGIKKFYLDTFQCLQFECSRLLASKLNRIISRLYFSFLDSSQQHIIGVYSDFRDYTLTLYNTDTSRKLGKILVNTNRATYSTYQVEPLSPMALSYRMRLFFLEREKPEENFYTYIIFLNDEEISKIQTIRAWASAAHEVFSR